MKRTSTGAVPAGSDDGSNIHALPVGDGKRKGILTDAYDSEFDGASARPHQAEGAEGIVRSESTDNADYRYGVRKVRRAEFDADPKRYVLSLGFPDFPPCPFGQSFSMLGFDTTKQEYVWLATKILRDERLQRIP